tara:strand:+ start:12 stop:158 length:147 start_codon:yes stop_codon:yes gene_type:complete
MNQRDIELKSKSGKKGPVTNSGTIMAHKMLKNLNKKESDLIFETIKFI